MTERVWNKESTKPWTGDVWKLGPILKKYRPDLKIDAYNCAPTGLLVIGNLDPDSEVLTQAYDEIVSEWMPLTLGKYGVQKYFDETKVRPALTAPWKNEAVSTNPRGLRIAIKVATHKPQNFDLWGDYHFAASLAKAFRRLGHNVRIDAKQDWYTDVPTDVDIVVRGLSAYKPQASTPCFIWIISHPDRLSENELLAMDHVFVASQTYASELAQKVSPDKLSVLLQATDCDIMKPFSVETGFELLFVGMNRPTQRASVEHALNEFYSLAIYGPNWGKHPRAHAHFRGGRIPNKDLGRYYAGAKAVLNDHWEDMRVNGFVSNRVFDVLACGSALITDDIEGVPDDIRPWIYVFNDRDSFRQSVDSALAEDDSRRQERKEFATHIHEHHSFDRRAERLLEVVSELKIQGTVESELLANG